MKIYDLDVEHINYDDVTKKPYLGEIKLSPGIYDIFKFGGCYCTLGIVSADRSYGGLRRLPDFDPDREVATGRMFVVCPICNYHDHDPEIETGPRVCGSCGALLDVNISKKGLCTSVVLRGPNYLEE